MTARIHERKRVLIVDDSSTMRAMLDGILANDPDFLVVGVARNGKEAMVLLHTARPQIVLTDLCMPETDGLELLAMLEDRPALCKVVMSTRINLSKDVEHKLTALGAAAIFDKQEIARDPKTFLNALHRATAHIIKSTTPEAAPATTVVQAAAHFPLPVDELARARAVKALNIANLDVDPRLNILSRHLARLSNYPIAAVNVIDSDRLWTKAAVGLAPGATPRGDTVCAHAICADGVTVIADMQADPLLRSLPMVAGGLQLRSYVGAPIFSQAGFRLGMVCVVDTKPRHPTPAEIDVLTDVAALVATALQSPISLLRTAA